jgi:HNH endonuclease
MQSQKLMEIKALWAKQLSTRQIAAIVAVSKSYVHRLLKDAGLRRDRIEAVCIRQPALSNHPRTSRSTSRRKMQRHLGRKLESWEHVHHKDGDYTNRDISNLEVLVDQDHYDHHWPNRHIPHEQKENRKAYKKEYNRNAYAARKLFGVSLT